MIFNPSKRRENLTMMLIFSQTESNARLSGNRTRKFEVRLKNTTQKTREQRKRSRTTTQKTRLEQRCDDAIQELRRLIANAVLDNNRNAQPANKPT